MSRTLSFFLLGAAMIAAIGGCSGDSLPTNESMANTTKGQLKAGPTKAKGDVSKVDAKAPPVTDSTRSGL